MCRLRLFLPIFYPLLFGFVFTHCGDLETQDKFEGEPYRVVEGQLQTVNTSAQDHGPTRISVIWAQPSGVLPHTESAAPETLDLPSPFKLSLYQLPERSLGAQYRIDSDHVVPITRGFVVAYHDNDRDGVIGDNDTLIGVAPRHMLIHAGEQDESLPSFPETVDAPIANPKALAQGYNLAEVLCGGKRTVSLVVEGAPEIQRFSESSEQPCKIEYRGYCLLREQCEPSVTESCSDPAKCAPSIERTGLNYLEPKGAFTFQVSHPLLTTDPQVRSLEVTEVKSNITTTLVKDGKIIPPRNTSTPSGAKFTTTFSCTTVGEGQEKPLRVCSYTVKAGAENFSLGQLDVRIVAAGPTEIREKTLDYTVTAPGYSCPLNQNCSPLILALLGDDTFAANEAAHFVIAHPYLYMEAEIKKVSVTDVNRNVSPLIENGQAVAGRAFNFVHSTCSVSETDPPNDPWLWCFYSIEPIAQSFVEGALEVNVVAANPWGEKDATLNFIVTPVAP